MRATSIGLLFAIVMARGSMACAVGSGDANDGGQVVDDFDSALPAHDSAIDDSADEAAATDAEAPDAGASDARETGGGADVADLADVGALDDATADTPSDGGCTAKCDVCGAADGCGGTCATGACGAGASCVAGTCVAATRSHLSPGTYPALWAAFAKGTSWTMASEAPATIRYTVDGSPPDATSPSGPSPLTIFIATSGTTLRWLADDGVAETAHSFDVVIAPTLQPRYGYLAHDVALDGLSPVVVVAPGTPLNGSAKYSAWVSTGCPLCRQQLVYGIGSVPAGCIYDGSPSTWPGVSGSGAMKLIAPATAGTYKVRLAFALQLSCSDALTKANPLGVEPTTEIGTIVVK